MYYKMAMDKCTMMLIVLVIFVIICAIYVMNKSEKEGYAYGSSSYVAPGEYEAFGITNPVYAP